MHVQEMIITITLVLRFAVLDFIYMYSTFCCVPNIEPGKFQWIVSKLSMVTQTVWLKSVGHKRKRPE